MLYRGTGKNDKNDDDVDDNDDDDNDDDNDNAGHVSTVSCQNIHGKTKQAPDMAPKFDENVQLGIHRSQILP